MPVETITTISPSTNKAVVTRNGLSESEFAALTSNSEAAFKQWKQVKFARRLEIVRKALDLILQKKDVLARELTEQMGRPITKTPFEITTAVDRGVYMCSVAEEALADTPGADVPGFKRFVRKVPVGPVLVIFAWNYPYLILVNSLVPALLAGNTVIIKPSPQTPTIAEQVRDMFLEAGLPPNVVQYFHTGSLQQVESLIKADEIKHVCFTGSVAGGLAVKSAANNRIAVGVGLELGGKDPAYVRADVDVDYVAAEIVDGAIFNSGQSCCSVERVYVAAEIHDSFVAAVQKVLRGYVLGDPFDEKTQLGPVVSKRSAETIRDHVRDAVSKGAKDVTPDNSSFKSPPPDGNYVAPVLLTHVTHNMKVMTEETFGPIIPVMSVKDDEEAIRLMNDSQFGLTASIWSKDVAKAAELAEHVEAGTVFVNRCDMPVADLAWTGWKDSGKGQTLSKYGFDQFVKLKSFHLKDYMG